MLCWRLSFSLTVFPRIPSQINNVCLNSVSRSVSGGIQHKILKGLLNFFMNASTEFYNETNLGDPASSGRELLKD